MCQPTRLWEDSEAIIEKHAHADSNELRRYFESSLFELGNISTIERASLILYYEWGFKEKEIGHCFGYSESRACQVIRQGESRIQKALVLEAQRENRSKEQREVSQEVQVRPTLQETTQRILEKIRFNQAQRLEKTGTEIQEQIEIRAFSVASF